MAFTREDLAAYEKGPQRQIDDKVSPFRDATPARAADPAAVAAVAAGHVDATPGGTPAAAAASAPITDDAPVVDEDGTLGDPTDSGEGTSDEPASDSSTDPVDHGDEADPNSDLTGDEEPAPKKGSARERIVELLDLTEGYKEYGKMRDAENRELREQLARLKGEPTSAAAPPAAEVVSEADEPMPDMADEDVQFDTDKYRAKMAKWVKAQTASAARQAVQEVTGAQSTQKARESLERKIEAYSKDHEDFETVVTKNPVLAANPLSTEASAVVVDSEHTAEVLYRFGKDPKLAVRVARMSPIQQVVHVTNMIRDIEDERKAAAPNSQGQRSATPQGGAKPAQKKSTTQAPPPPRPLAGGGRATQRDTTDSTMSMEEFARRHRAEKQSARESARKMRGLS